MQRLRFLLIALCAVVLSLEGHAKVIVRDGVYYDLNYETKTASVTSGDRKYQGEVYIAGWVESDGIRFDVTEIGEGAFRGCIWLTYVSMPTTIISIGKLAFADCDQLASVRMSESLTTIEANAFSHCTSLTSITLPKSLKAIGAYAFFNCAELTSIIIPDSVTSIGSSAFALCSKLKSMTIPNSVTDLGDLVCYHCIRLTSVTIGDSVTSIGKGAFCFCNDLESVIIGKSVMSIGSEAFYQTYLSAVTIPNSVTSIGESAFRECSALKSVTIGNSVTKIDKYAFKDCTRLTNIVCCAVTIPTIDDYTFTDFDCTLFAPYNLIDSYKNSSQWRFHRIIGFTGVPTESISLSHTEVTLQSGEEIQLVSTVLPEAAVNNPLIWNSNDPSVASVDSYGLVRAVSVGETTISASFADIATSCIITVEPTPISELTLSQTSVTLKVTEEIQLTATIYPETTTDKTVVWSSSNPAVATVDATGKVTAISIGESIVTASCGAVKATCIIKVEPTAIQSISLSPSNWSGFDGESFTISASISPVNATDKTLEWTSSDKAIAVVDNNGNVNIVGIGECIITAAAADGSGVSASCSVTVKPVLVESISLDPAEWICTKGQSLQVNARILPANADDLTLTWSSDDESVATVNSDGLVTAVGIGECIITASAADGSGVSASCSVTVKPVLVESISLDPAEWICTKGQSLQVNARILPANADDLTLTWSSDDESVATVNSDGLVTAVGIGECIITASAADGSGVSASCSVIVKPVLVESISLDPAEWSGFEGEIFQINAIITPDEAENKTIEWASSDISIATVDNNGLVNVIKDGSCIISARTTDGSDLSAECIVTSISGIDDIFADADERFDIYNMQGLLIKKDCNRDNLKNLSSGIYIIRQDNKTKKIIVK